MEQILEWNANDISVSKWKKSVYHQRFHKQVDETKRLYERVRTTWLKRAKQVAIWKKTRDVSVYHKSIQETKERYADAVASFLLHPETSTLKEQNKLIGSTMRSSLTSMGIIPSLKDGTIKIHEKYV